MHLHADRAAVLDQDALDQGARADVQVGALAHRLEICRGRGAARAVALGNLVQTEAVLARAVEVVVARVSRLGGRVDQGGRQRVVVAQVGDAQ
ncbi:MAG TPA: hypothetical protein VIL60_06750 [Rhodanobacter sp.]